MGSQVKAGERGLMTLPKEPRGCSGERASGGGNAQVSFAKAFGGSRVHAQKEAKRWREKAPPNGEGREPASQSHHSPGRERGLAAGPGRRLAGGQRAEWETENYSDSRNLQGRLSERSPVLFSFKLQQP